MATGAEEAHVTVQVPATPTGSAVTGGRGDSTLAKACPSLQGLTKKTYRQMRIRLQTYRSMAKRRGEEAEADAAFLLLNQVQDYHFWAVENFDHSLLHTENPYDAVMRSVGGSSPAMLALGYVPRIPGCHDEFNLAQQTRHQDVQSQAHEDLMRRTAAAKAYLEANASRSVRMCLLARSRPEIGGNQGALERTRSCVFS